MADPNAIFLEVAEILKDFLDPSERVTMDTTLFVDLGLFGDDAGEFLDAFAHRLNVDVSTLVFERHFPPEGYTCFELLILPFAGWRRFFFSGRKNANFIPITIRQLVEAAVNGRWPAVWSRAGEGKGDAAL